MSQEFDEFITFLPKIELHAHLNGSITAACLAKLALKKGQTWEPISSPDLALCFKQFAKIHELVQDAEDVQFMTESVLRQFAEEQTWLLELRTTPRPTDKLTAAEYIQTVIDTIKTERTKYPDMVIALMLSFDRARGFAAGEEVLNLARQWHIQDPNLVAGVDLSGNPNVGDIHTFIPLLQAARNDGLKLAVHAAEIPNEEEMKSIFQLRPDRIGHGTCIHPTLGGSEALWEELKRLQIPVEACLTSNVISKTTNRFEDHHMNYLWRERMPFCICTDDCGVFQTTITQEYHLARQTLQLTNEDLMAINDQAVSFSFLHPVEKHTIQRKMKNWSL